MAGKKRGEWEKPVLDLIRAWVSSSEPEKAVLGEQLSEVIRSLSAENEPSIPRLFREARRPPKKPREHQAERLQASISKADRVGQLRQARDTGELGEEAIKMAQALILCSIPHRPTTETKIVREARLGDGSTLLVTFSAVGGGVAMPYGADANLLHWLIDRAIREKSSFVSFRSASQYLTETGKTDGGPNIRDLTERLRRLSGLVINVQRQGENSDLSATIPVISKAHLPKTSTGFSDATQQELPGVEKYGVQLSDSFFRDMLEHHLAFPRELWLALQESGAPQQQNIILWLVGRAYATKSESVVPWTSLLNMFGSSDGTVRKLKPAVIKAVRALKVIWKEVDIEVLEAGLLFRRPATLLLPDDPSKNRVRSLS